MKKHFYIQENIGKCKYVLSYHDGVSTHPDGSPFFGAYLFRNKVKLYKQAKELLKMGYLHLNTAAYERR